MVMCPKVHVCLVSAFTSIHLCSNQCISGLSDRWVWMQIETSLAAATTGSGAVAGRPAPTLLIQQALEAIARISKGFNANLCTRVRPEIGKHLPSIHFDVCMAPGSAQQLRFQDSSCTPGRNDSQCGQGSFVPAAVAAQVSKRQFTGQYSAFRACPKSSTPL